jgi:hypothetical protein
MSPLPSAGFRTARRLLVAALTEGRYEAEDRADIEAKNLLFTGDVDAAFVVRLLNRCPGTAYRASPHHYDSSIIVHEFFPRDGNTVWYIKVYFLDEIARTMSVHP